MPESALREALLNAVIHRDYAVPAPIQIRVYADRLLIWNPGELPEGWSMEKLLGPTAVPQSRVKKA
jgi:ATP-dependent DNA helicase RecG